MLTHFPELFLPPSKKLDETPFVYWGFECGDGWFTLIKELAEKLNQLPESEEFKVVQVKEKLGTLRFYMRAKDGRKSDALPHSILDLIRQVESQSAVTCEACGNPGKLSHKGGWWKTRCSKTQCATT